MRKSALCRFFESNQCSKGTACPFAHGEAELQTRPNLSKTTICRNWAKGCCKFNNATCNFAHGQQDLRDTCEDVASGLHLTSGPIVSKSNSFDSDAPTRCPSEISYDSENEGYDTAVAGKLRSCLRNESSSPLKKQLEFARFVDVVFIPAEGRGLSIRSSKGKYSNESYPVLASGLIPSGCAF